MKRSATRIALSIACLSLLVASSARAAGAPVLATGTNTFDGHGGSVVRAYVNRNGEELTGCSFEYGETEAYGQSEACLGRDEVQTVAVSATAGEFRLSFEGQTTADIPYNASTALVQQRLEALTAIGPGAVEVTGGPPNEVRLRIVFQGSLADRDVEALGWEQGSEPLSGGSAAVTVGTEVQGGATGLDYLNAGPAEEGVEVTMDPQGLKPGATFHFRISAASAAGATQSEDSVFATPAEPEEPESCPNEAIRVEQHSTFLPECRAYEMVSPPDKLGSELSHSSEDIQAASDGEAVTFASVGGFSDVRGTGVTIEYMAERMATPGTPGWTTHAITPPQQQITYLGYTHGVQAHYAGDFSADLSKGAFLSNNPLTEEPNTAELSNLYLRTDLRTAGLGSYLLVSACPICTSPIFSPELARPPTFASASADFTRLLFQTPRKLTAGAGSVMNAYEFDDGQLRLVGILPNGKPAPSSVAGGLPLENTASHQGERAISSDGSKVFFEAPAPVSGSTATNLYMRLNNTETVQLNASERKVADAHYPAFFEDATGDGSRVFFTTEQALTDDAPIGRNKLYSYDTTRPASDPHNLTYIATLKGRIVGGALIGAADDGGTVFFIGRPQRANEFPAGDPAVFAWHEGHVSYVGTLEQGEDTGRDAFDTNAKLESRVTDDGTLIFTTSTPTGPTGYDQIGCNGRFGCRELYLYRFDTKTLQCISCRPSGMPPDSDASDFAFEGSAAAWKSHQARAISADGSLIFFNTGDSLVQEDTNGVGDAYLFDRQTGEVRLVSSGTDSAPSYAAEMSPDGKDLFFLTRQRLAGWDRDRAYDLYDARIGGGFAEPPPAAPNCEGESCFGSPGSPAGAAATPSEAVRGSNPQPPCSRRALHVRSSRGGKCRKKHRRHKRRAHGGGQR